MKVGIFNTVRGGGDRFAPYLTEFPGIELVGFECPPTLKTLENLQKEGCEAMIYTADHREPEEFFAKIAACGVKYVCCCCAGFDHFDLEAMKKYGLKAANVPVYSPNAVSEHTVMLVLAALRNFRRQMLQVEGGNYQLKGLRGREIRNLTIGIVGTGRIGCTTMQCLSGFCPKKMLAFDPYPSEQGKKWAEYVSLERLYAESDVIIYHAMYNESNHHMVNEETIANMKDGVILVNTSRGGLFDAEAVLAGIESGKLGGVCLDVIEGEGILKRQPIYEECPLPALKKMLAHKNVIFTPHSAFFTDEADRNLTEGTMKNLYAYMTCGVCEKELVR